MFLKPHDAAGRNVIFQMHLARSGIGMDELHMAHLAAAFADLFNDGALIGFRHLDGQFLVRLE